MCQAWVENTKKRMRTPPPGGGGPHTWFGGAKHAPTGSKRPPLPPGPMDEDPEPVWDGDEPPNWDEWFQNKFSEAMVTHVANYNTFQQKLATQVQNSHESLKMAMGEKILHGLQKMCDSFAAQNAGDRAELAGCVEQLLQTSTQKIFDTCQEQIDTQIAQIQQKFTHETQEIFDACTTRFQKLEYECAQNFNHLGARIANLEGGTTMFMKNTREKMCDLDQKFSEMHMSTQNTPGMGGMSSNTYIHQAAPPPSCSGQAPPLPGAPVPRMPSPALPCAAPMASPTGQLGGPMAGLEATTAWSQSGICGQSAMGMPTPPKMVFEAESAFPQPKLEPGSQNVGGFQTFGGFPKAESFETAQSSWPGGQNMGQKFPNSMPLDESVPKAPCTGGNAGLAAMGTPPLFGMAPSAAPAVMPVPLMMAPLPSAMGPSAQINAITSAHESPQSAATPAQISPLLPLTCHPAIYATISTPIPKFKGDSNAWPEWKRKWNERMGLMRASGPLDDRILVSQFCESMDAVTKKIIDARRAENPDLTFGEIFQEVDVKFTKSARNTSRGKLEQMQLISAVHGKLTMREWENFDADFRILRSECSEIGDEEARRLFQKALPVFLIEHLQKELLRREKNPRAVFVGQSGCAPYQIKKWLEETFGTTFVRVTQEKVGIVVCCQDQAQFGTLLTLHGQRLQTGEVMSVRPIDPQLSLEEMRAICREALQPRENAFEIKAHVPPPFQKQPPRPSRVAAVGNEEDSSTCDGQSDAEVAAVAQGGHQNHHRGHGRKGQQKSGKGSAHNAPPPPPPAQSAASSNPTIANPSSSIDSNAPVSSSHPETTNSTHLFKFQIEGVQSAQPTSQANPAQTAEKGGNNANWNRQGGYSNDWNRQGGNQATNWNRNGGQNGNRDGWNQNQGESWNQNRYDYQNRDYNPNFNNQNGKGGNQGKGNPKGGKGGGKGKGGKGGKGYDNQNGKGNNPPQGDAGPNPPPMTQQ